MLLSLFCGAGGLDLGFERAGFDVALAFDKKEDSVVSYNHNRAPNTTARRMDVRELTLDILDQLYGGVFRPTGVIGGPPCQSFSRSNPHSTDEDPRHELPGVYARLLNELNARSPLSFFALENVPGLRAPRHAERFARITSELSDAGFNIHLSVLNARNYTIPQNRERLFVVGFNRDLLGNVEWDAPAPTSGAPETITVASAIHGLAEPTRFERGLNPAEFPVHRNHWCMKPKSPKFSRPGALVPGTNGRSFRTLAWDAPSMTVAYGNREVHIHPDRHRRLSVYEAMLLQGFPPEYILHGNLSSQFAQVSEAVPPALAHAVAMAIRDRLP